MSSPQIIIIFDRLRGCPFVGLVEVLIHTLNYTYSTTRSNLSTLLAVLGGSIFWVRLQRGKQAL